MAIYSIPNNIELKNISEQTEIVEKQSFKDELAERKKVISELIEKYSFIYPPSHRVIVAVDLWYKNRVALGDSGVVLERPRGYDEFNMRLTQPVQGFVINDNYAPIGAEILVNHNSFHETNKLFAFDNEINTKAIAIYSIPKMECYVYKPKGGDWLPYDGFLLGEYIFEPYKGVIEGIDPKLLKNYLFVTSDGYLKNKVVKTVHAALYPIVCNDENYKEHTIIRIRHFENDADNPREEVICVMNEMTKQVLSGELLIGTDKSNIKKYEKNDDVSNSNTIV